MRWRWPCGAASGCPRRWRARTGGLCPSPISPPRSGRRSATATSIGNTLAATLAFGGLFGFIGSIQQIVFDVFDRPELIGLVFACIAGPMGISSYANSRLVMRLGARRLLLTALGAFTIMALLHLAIVLAYGETLWVFVVLQALTTACFGLVGANSGALAMEPVGHIAGTASALQGLITTVGGALIGLLVGQLFDGTTVPLDRRLRGLRRARSGGRALGEPQAEGRARRSGRGPVLEQSGQSGRVNRPRQANAQPVSARHAGLDPASTFFSGGGPKKVDPGSSPG